MGNRLQAVRAQKNEEIAKLRSQLSNEKKEYEILKQQASGGMQALLEQDNIQLKQKDELITEKTKQISDMGNEIVKMRLELEELRVKHSCPDCKKELSHEKCACKIQF